MNLAKLFSRNNRPPQLTASEYLELIIKNDEALQLFQTFLKKEFSTENLAAFITLRRFTYQGSCSPIFRHTFFNEFLSPAASTPLNLSSLSAVSTPHQLDAPQFDRIEHDIVMNLLDSWSRFCLTPEGKRAIRLLS
ncbi:hypothetical protein GO613_07255 [Azoarcus communis]|uniref:hypothetical protein n=1 Tax=Parazoarcus communis TaxID=41977 RepID=UPI00145941AE|nr:hypothetical protein [Parazoarcus communis]NMG47893.1 hypothetical protein [Parazoarcus communis]